MTQNEDSKLFSTTCYGSLCTSSTIYILFINYVPSVLKPMNRVQFTLQSPRCFSSYQAHNDPDIQKFLWPISLYLWQYLPQQKCHVRKLINKVFYINKVFFHTSCPVCLFPTIISLCSKKQAYDVKLLTFLLKNKNKNGIQESVNEELFIQDVPNVQK